MREKRFGFLNQRKKTQQPYKRVNSLCKPGETIQLNVKCKWILLLLYWNDFILFDVNIIETEKEIWFALLWHLAETMLCSIFYLKILVQLNLLPFEGGGWIFILYYPCICLLQCIIPHARTHARRRKKLTNVAFFCLHFFPVCLNYFIYIYFLFKN